MEGAIGGVIFHHSLLLHDAIPNPAADSLLRKLRHSAIPTAISHEPGISSDKMNLLKNMATLYSMDCFSLDPSSSPLDDAVNEIMLAWHHVRGTILLLLADDKKEVFHKPANCNWHIVGLTVEGASPCEGLGINKINRLEELPLTICRINRKAVGDNVVTVGYIMKPSREEDFAKRGAFPMYPTHNGLIFLPLTFDLPLTPQLQEADIVLHKATDEIVSIELGDSAEYPNKITYTTGMEELKM